MGVDDDEDDEHPVGEPAQFSMHVVPAGSRMSPGAHAPIILMLQLPETYALQATRSSSPRPRTGFTSAQKGSSKSSQGSMQSPDENVSQCSGTGSWEHVPVMSFEVHP